MPMIVQSGSRLRNWTPPGGGGNSAPVNTVAPAISGSPRVGSPTLSTPGTWTGTPTPVLTYQWRIANDVGGPWSDISGATSSTYTPIEADEGKYLRLRVTATNGVGSPVTADSSTSAAIAEMLSPVSLGLQHGVNIGQSAYWVGVQNLINLLHDAEDTRTWPVEDRARLSPQDRVPGESFPKWQTITLAHNESFSRIVITNMTAQGGFKPGNFVAKMVNVPGYTVEGQNFYLDLANSSGITNKVAGTGRLTFTTTGEQSSFWVECWNQTGGVRTIHGNNVVVMRAEHEALWDAGEIFTPEFIADLQHYTQLRFLDECGVNHNRIRSIDDLPTPENFISGDWPIEYMMRLCKRVGAEPWFNLPILMDKYNIKTINSSTNRMTLCEYVDGMGQLDVDIPWSEGDKIMLRAFDDYLHFSPLASTQERVPMYVRNVSGNSFQVSLTPTGSIESLNALDAEDAWLVPITKVYDAAAHIAVWNHLLDRAHAEWPECRRYHIEVGNEQWNPGNPFYRGHEWCRTVGYYIATGQGAPISNAPYGQSYGRGAIHINRLGWKAAMEKLGASRVVPHFNAQMWAGSVRDDMGVVDASVFNDGKNAFQQLRDYGGRLSIAPYTYVRRDYIGDWGDYADFNNGSGEANTLITEGAIEWPDSTWAYHAHYSFENAKIYFAQWDDAIEDFDAVGLKKSAYEFGWHGGDQVTHFEGDQYNALQVAWMDFFLRSTSSAAVACRNEYQQVLRDAGFDYINYYVDAGGWAWSGDGLQIAWGIKRTHYMDDDNEYSAFYKGSETAVREWIVGHSLSPKPWHGNFDAIVNGLSGLSIEAHSQEQPGTPIRAFVGDPPDFDGFTTAMPGDRDARDEWENPILIDGDDYTHFMATEVHDIAGSLHGGNTFLNMMAYYEAVHARLPNAKFYVQSCWKDNWQDGGTSYGCGDAATVDLWIAYERAMQKVWDALVERINLTLANRGRSDRVYSAPMAWMLAECMDRVANGNVTHLTLGTKQATLDQFFEDGVHIGTPMGDYLHSLMNFVCVYRRSPVGGGRQTSGDWAVTANQAAAMQQLVWDVYRTYQQWHPTMAEARAYMTASNGPLQQAFNAWRTPTTWEYGSGSLFGVTNYTPVDIYGTGFMVINPFWFDPATDEAGAGYLGVP